MAHGKTVVVTGANRGLGLALTKQLAAGGSRVVVAVRDVSRAQHLQALGPVLVTQLDCASDSSVQAWGERLAREVDHVDCVINNAGIIDRGSLEDATAAGMMDLFQTNTVGPMLVTQQLMRHNLLGPPESLIVNISSILGSIGDDTLQDYSVLPYRCSKAALNMLSKRMDVELSRDGKARCIMVHPGAVQTDMSGGVGVLTPEESAAAILALLQREQGVQGGSFYSYDGRELPW